MQLTCSYLYYVISIGCLHGRSISISSFYFCIIILGDVEHVPPQHLPDVLGGLDGAAVAHVRPAGQQRPQGPVQVRVQNIICIIGLLVLTYFNRINQLGKYSADAELHSLVNCFAVTAFLPLNQCG